MSGQDIEVVIRDVLGYYLADDAEGQTFVSTKEEARVFHYHRDCVEEFLANINKRYGDFWTAEPLDLEKYFERCDTCGDLFECSDCYYDGTTFVCRECRAGIPKPTAQ